MIKKLQDILALIKAILTALMTAVAFVETLSETDGTKGPEKLEQALTILKSSIPVETLPSTLQPYADIIYKTLINAVVAVANKTGVFTRIDPQVPCNIC